MSIACILSGKGERQTKTRACRDQSPISIPIDGNVTAEALPLSHANGCLNLPKTPAHSGTWRALAGKPLFNEAIRYWRDAVGCSWLFHGHRGHAATVARLNWRAKSPEISIHHGPHEPGYAGALLPHPNGGKTGSCSSAAADTETCILKRSPPTTVPSLILELLELEV
jgi:hypothetical protein